MESSCSLLFLSGAATGLNRILSLGVGIAFLGGRGGTFGYLSALV